MSFTIKRKEKNFYGIVNNSTTSTQTSAGPKSLVPSILRLNDATVSPGVPTSKECIAFGARLVYALRT